MKILFTFPGQGPQRPGMLASLPGGDALLAEASEVLHEDARQLDMPQALQHTRAVQLSLLICGVAHARALVAAGVEPDMVSGLSIGAFPAAVMAGALGYTDALRLVALRGDLMEQAYPAGFGLTAVLGLTQSELEPLLGESYLANINAERQMVIAGSDAAMRATASRARQHGARCAKRLAVSVPSHCALLAEPAARLAEAFAAVTLARPRCAYLSGSSGRVLWQPAQIADDLAQNMARRVRWFDAMTAASERDVGLALEMPPGAVLTGLTRPALSRGEAMAVEQNKVSVLQTLAARTRGSR